LTHLDKTPKHK